MKRIDTDYACITFLDDDVVLSKAKDSIEVSAEVARKRHELIINEAPGDYGIILDREADYSVDLGGVYKVLNDLPELKAIAIVRHRNITAEYFQIEKILSKKPLNLCDSVEDAYQWIKATMH